jgi:hypothetical protein
MLANNKQIMALGTVSCLLGCRGVRRNDMVKMRVIIFSLYVHRDVSRLFSILASSPAGTYAGLCAAASIATHVRHWMIRASRVIAELRPPSRRIEYRLISKCARMRSFNRNSRSTPFSTTTNNAFKAYL